MSLKIIYSPLACSLLCFICFACYYAETEAYYANQDSIDCKEGQMQAARFEMGTKEEVPDFLQKMSDFGIYVDTTNRAINFVSFHEDYLRTSDSSMSGENPDSIHKVNNTNKQQVWIYNRSEKDVTLQMQDWWYICILQAKTPNGNWQPIQYWRFSSCGNSYYDETFKPNTANSFVFEIPKYGDFKTQLRFKLLGKEIFHYSNSFAGSINLCDFVENEKTYIRLRHAPEPNYKLDSLINVAGPY